MMSATKAAELGLTPVAVIRASALVGCDPVMMLEGPIPATEKDARKPAGIGDIDVFEVNGVLRFRGVGLGKNRRRRHGQVNPNGGAIALGHPLGATGCILVTKAVHELHRTEGRYGLISMCCGGGLGTGTSSSESPKFVAAQASPALTPNSRLHQ